MNPFDLIVILLLIAGFIWGFNKGFIYMIFSLLAIIGGIFGASKLTPLVEPFLFNSQNQKIGSIVLFVIFFTIIYFIIKKLTYLLEDMVELLELEWLDSLLGGFLGLFQFLVIIGAIISILLSTGFIQQIPQYSDIKVAFLLSEASQRVISLIAGSLPQIQSIN